NRSLAQIDAIGWLVFIRSKIEGQFATNDRLDALGGRLFGKLQRAEQIVRIGDTDGRLPVLGGHLQYRAKRQSAFEQRKSRMNVKMDEARACHALIPDQLWNSRMARLRISSAAPSARESNEIGHHIEIEQHHATERGERNKSHEILDQSEHGNLQHSVYALFFYVHFLFLSRY